MKSLFLISTLALLIVAQDAQIQTITAKVGDTVTLQLDEPINSDGLTWDIIENVLGYNKIWSVAEENFVINEGINDGVKTGLRSFKLKIKKVGEELITLARGDMTKFDDAEADYDKSSQNYFDLNLMRAAEYTQVKLKVEPAEGRRLFTNN